MIIIVHMNVNLCMVYECAGVAMLRSGV